MTETEMLAMRYHTDVHAADVAAVPGEPEAQLTTPVSNLFTALVEHAGLGRLRLIRGLGYRTAKGTGRAASSNNPLDKIRPAAWPDAWNDELLDLLRLLTRTLDLQPMQSDLLDRICAGSLVGASELPMPTVLQRKPPK